MCLLYYACFLALQTNKSETSLWLAMQKYSKVQNLKQSTPLRRSTVAHLKRARTKTLQMTVAIVAVFLVCWSPYFVMALLHFLDTDFRTGARRGQIQVPVVVEECLYMFATLNSCLNPYLYGYFIIDWRQEIRSLLAKCRARRKKKESIEERVKLSTILQRNRERRQLPPRESSSPAANLCLEDATMKQTPMLADSSLSTPGLGYTRRKSKRRRHSVVNFDLCAQGLSLLKREDTRAMSDVGLAV